MTAPTFDGSFRHNWTAEILPQRPMILPSRHFVYPNAAEEVEKGALEVLVQPAQPVGAQPFLATCALGFRDLATPTGIWSCPDPDWMCAVSGGYAYLIDVAEPSRFAMVRYRPVLDVLSFRREKVQSAGNEAQSATNQLQSMAGEVQSAAEFLQSARESARASGRASDRASSGHADSDGLLLFLGHHSILAWGKDGEAWESDRLSSEGITEVRIEVGEDGGILRGKGWDLRTDRDLPFALDLRTGKRI